MRRLNLKTAVAVTAAAIIMGCGNGSGSSKLKNEYIGSMPAIHADYEAKAKVLREKMNKSGANEHAKWMEEIKLHTEKSEDALRAELAKIAGTDVPVSFSKALTESDKAFFNVESAKIPPVETRISTQNDLLSAKAVLTAKKAFSIPYKEKHNYEIYCRAITTDGTTLDKYSITPSKFWESKSDIAYTAGELIVEKHIYLSSRHDPESWAKFAGIEFITKEEYDALPK